MKFHEDYPEDCVQYIAVHDSPLLVISKLALYLMEKEVIV